MSTRPVSMTYIATIAEARPRAYIWRDRVPLVQKSALHRAPCIWDAFSSIGGEPMTEPKQEVNRSLAKLAHLHDRALTSSLFFTATSEGMGGWSYQLRRVRRPEVVVRAGGAPTLLDCLALIELAIVQESPLPIPRGKPR
jgi:hypothetical protein